MLKSVAAAAAVFACLAAGAQAQSAKELPAALKESGVLKLTINSTYPPLEFKDPDSGEFKGLDIDLVDAIAQRLNLKVERSDGLFKELIPALSTGRTAFILSGFSDTPERQETMDFVDYMTGGPQFYVLTGSPITDPMELCGKKVGTVRSTSYPAQIKDWSDKNCVAANKPEIEVIGTESSPDARTQLQQGRVAAAVQGGEGLPFIDKQAGGNVYRIIGKPIATVYYAAAFRKDDTTLRNAVAATLQDMVADGSYAKIFEKWDLSKHALPEITINREPIQK